MLLRELKDSTDPELRSLLQKAVRRGFPRVVECAARRLSAMGDGTWLRSRTAILCFEECWPFAEHLALDTSLHSKVSSLAQIASMSKQKDAAGLGALAFAHHEGDRSMLDLVPDAATLRFVSGGLGRPERFLESALTARNSEKRYKIVGAAHQYLRSATWGSDRATILAAGFLASRAEVTECVPAITFTSEFPYWVTFDRHTERGKGVLRDLGLEFRVSYRQLLWTEFYFESAKVNSLFESPWWHAEKKWRLRREGLSLEVAAALWEKMQPILIDRLDSDANELRSRIEPFLDITGLPTGLFD